MTLTYVLVGLGITLFLLALWQLSTGLRWIKLPGAYRVRIHRWTGISLVTIACLHAPLGLYYTGIIRLP